MNKKVILIFGRYILMTILFVFALIKVIEKNNVFALVMTILIALIFIYGFITRDLKIIKEGLKQSKHE